MKHTTEEWVDNDEDCPICGNKCQSLTETDLNNIQYDNAEKCKTCKWVVFFEKE